MKLALAEPRILVDSVSVISELVNDVVLKVDKEKIELIAMDPANVAMVVFKLLSSAFTEYQVEGAQEIAISLDAFRSILKRAKPTDVVTIELDQEKNKLKIQFKSENTRTFNLALIDMENKQQKIPDLTFPLRIETGTHIFDEAIADMDIISESVAFSVDKEKFLIEAESNLNDAKVEISKDDETTIKFSGEPVKTKYSLEYLKKIIKGSKISSNVSIQFSKDYPLRIDYQVKDKVSLSFILAPRVSND